MRIEPDGLELLRAARVVLRAAIVPHVPPDRRNLIEPIERALALGEDRLSLRARASVDDLTTLERACAIMRGAVFDALPEAQRFDARLVAKAIAIGARQLAHADVLKRREYERLARLLDGEVIVLPGADEVDAMLTSLNEQLCARIRAGEVDLGTTSYTATLAHLEATTDEALSESDPMNRPPLVESVMGEASAAPAGSFIDAAVRAWGQLPRALVRAFVDSPSAPPASQMEAWRQLRGTLGEAVYASGNAAISTQASLFGCFTQRLAANPRVPMVAVEGAHQAHDLSLAIADANMAIWKLALAPFRGVQAARTDTSRTS